MTSSHVFLPLLVFSCFLVTTKATQSLVKKPDSDSVMISETVAGIKLTCYFNTSFTVKDRHRRDSEEEQNEEQEQKKKVVVHHIKWYMTEVGNEDEEEIDEEDYVYLDDQGRSVLRMKPDDVKLGKVRCEGTDPNLSGSDPQSHEWQINPYFRVDKLPKSTEVVKGEDLKLFCQLRPDSSTDGELEFEWYKMPADVEKPEEYEQAKFLGNGTSEIRTATDDKIDPHIRIFVFTNESALKLEDTVYEDRAIYRCVAKLTSNLVTTKLSFSSSTYTLVRVKDKYAALYPFIGIICEIIALGLFICVCERRSKAADEGEGEAEEEEAVKNGGRRQDGNVRQRRN